MTEAPRRQAMDAHDQAAALDTPPTLDDHRHDHPPDHTFDHAHDGALPTARWHRAEGAAVLALALVAYGTTGANWWLFAALVLVPDLSMVGYAAGPRTGALIYNLAHTYSAPAALIAVAFIASQPLVLAAAIVWIAHIALDRMLGYGLKLSGGFKSTDLGSL